MSGLGTYYGASPEPFPFAAAVILVAGLIAPRAGAQESTPTEITLPPQNHQVSSSLMWWTSFEDYQIAAPLAFNTPVYEATISASHTSLDFLSGTVAGGVIQRTMAPGQANGRFSLLVSGGMGGRSEQPDGHT